MRLQLRSQLCSRAASIAHGDWVCEYVGDLLQSPAEMAARAAVHLRNGVAVRTPSPLPPCSADLPEGSMEWSHAPWAAQGGTSYMVMVEDEAGGGGGQAALAIDATVRGGVPSTTTALPRPRNGACPRGVRGHYSRLSQHADCGWCGGAAQALRVS